jgi:hypothetical protein
MKLFTYPNGQLFQFASNVRGSRMGFIFRGIGLEFSAGVTGVCVVADVEVLTLAGVGGFVGVAVVVVGGDGVVAVAVVAC